MSKHFELMEGMERRHLSSFPSTSAPVASVQDRTATNINSNIRLVDDEVLQLVQQIFFLQSENPPHVVAFAGIDHGNGCSQVCAAVAAILGRNSKRPVCLAEANFRSPNLTELFGTSNHYGLADALSQSGPITSFMKSITQHDLWLLSSGILTVDSPSLLNSEYLHERLDELRREFEFVIVDAPPLAHYSDAILLGQHCDGLVVVLEADNTRRDEASTVAATLRSSKTQLLAVVLNQTTSPIPSTLYRRL